jgi:D-amino peptidase
MNIYIFADMEGISGISNEAFLLPDGRCYAEGRRYMTWDINACAEGCFDGGATRVWVRDGHASGLNVLWSELDPRIELVQGPGNNRRMPGLDDCDALILLGYHTMAGTRFGLLEHTYSSRRIQNLWINGQRVGEFGLDSAIAGDMGIPTIMVSGDDMLCAEARELIPEIVTCQVKTSVSCQGARLLSREVAHQHIREDAAEAVRRARDIPVRKVQRPPVVRLELVERGQLPNDRARPEITVVDGRTYEASAETVEQAFQRLS